MSNKIIRLQLSEKLWVNPTIHEPNKRKRGLPCFLVLSRDDFWMIWRCHGITCFYFCFLFRNNGKREQLDGNDFRRCCGNFFRRCHSESTWSQLCSKFFFNNYGAPWQRHLKDTLQFKILRTWINVGVAPTTRHLTYYFMLLFLSNNPSFKIEPSVDRIIFATICLPFYLSIFYVSWSSSSTSTPFS